MDPISIDLGFGQIVVGELPSLGFCTACNHRRYESKKHPEWFACHCAEPVFEKIPEPVTASPLGYEDYGC